MFIVYDLVRYSKGAKVIMGYLLLSPKKFLCKNFLLANLDQPVFRLIFGLAKRSTTYPSKTAQQARFYSLSKPVFCPVIGEYYSTIACPIH